MKIWVKILQSTINSVVSEMTKSSENNIEQANLNANNLEEQKQLEEQRKLEERNKKLEETKSKKGDKVEDYFDKPSAEPYIEKYEQEYSDPEKYRGNYEGPFEETMQESAQEIADNSDINKSIPMREQMEISELSEKVGGKEVSEKVTENANPVKENKKE